MTLSTAAAGWITFAGYVLVIAVLHWGEAIFVPIAIAVLVAFPLAAVVSSIERGIGRVAAVLVVVTLSSVLVGLTGWGLMRQAGRMVEDLPTYRQTIRAKIADVRWLQRGGLVERLQETVDDIKADMAGAEPAPEPPVVVAPEQNGALGAVPTWVGPILEPLGTAGLVIVLVIFMLIEREDLRNRLFGLFGDRRLAVTTKALDEAAMRVSRYLLMQSLVNLLYGIGVCVGLLLLGVPYAPLWAVLGAALRFIPYVGPVAAAGMPILVSLAALPGWSPALMVTGLFVVLELFTNLVLETVLYADAAGISQTALLIAIAFWAWLWGPPGLLLATPLTVCLVVLGKHVPGLQFLSTLMAEGPALEPEVRLYQRLLARDEAEAAALIDEHVEAGPPEAVFDELLIPALTHAEHDRLGGRLSAEESRQLVATARELVRDVIPAVRAASVDRTDGKAATAARNPEVVLGVAIEAEADELALEMLGALLDGLPLRLEIAAVRLLPSEIVTLVAQSGCRILCIADLPPSPDSRVRYLVRKVKAAVPELTILVGRWAPQGLDPFPLQGFVDAGAAHVGTSLLETRDHLARLVADAGTPTPPAFLAEHAGGRAPGPVRLRRERS